MILLDTNVISETFRRVPHPEVIAWLNAQPSASLYLCTPVFAELLFGISSLPAGERKGLLHAAVDRLENDLYRDRILVFDVAASKEYARIAAARAAAGKAAEQMDTMIAAIAVAYRAAIATRNVKHFSDLDIDVLDPFGTPLSAR